MGAYPEQDPRADIQVAGGSDRYILELLGASRHCASQSNMIGNGYISIEPAHDGEGLGRWSIRYRRKLTVDVGPTKVFWRMQNVGKADDLERAFQTADKYAERTVGRDLYSQISRYAQWRQRPASRKAIGVLLRMRGVREPDDVKELEIMGRTVVLDRLKAGEVASYM